MALKNQTRLIDGANYMVQEFPALHSVRLAIKLQKTFAPALASAVGLIDFKGMISKKEMPKLAGMQMNFDAMVPTVQALTAELDPDTFAKLCLDLLAGTRKEGIELGNQAGFDNAFNGSLSTVFKVLWFVLEVNDFFGLGGILKLAGKAPGMMPPSQESSTQT